jgi:hypothetical protein
MHLAFLVEPTSFTGYVWDVFNRYTGTSLACGFAKTREAATAAARAFIAR